jgi:hypothetical protein
LSTEKGTIHTKRHSQEDPQKEIVAKTELTLTGSLRSAGSMASSAGTEYNLNPRGEFGPKGRR